MERLSSTEKYNLERQHPQNLWSSRLELEERYGLHVGDLLGGSKSTNSEPLGLGMGPVEDIVRLLEWAYSTPLRAIITSSGLFLGAVHFGIIHLPMIVFLIGKWLGAGMMVTSAVLATKEMVVKINGVRIDKKGKE